MLFTTRKENGLNIGAGRGCGRQPYLLGEVFTFGPEAGEAVVNLGPEVTVGHIF